MNEIIRVLWVSSLSFIAIAIVARIMGKKQLAQLGFVDYVVGISIGSIAGAMAIEPDIPFYHFIIALIIYMLLDIIINFLTRKIIFVKKVLKGQPLIIIENGKLKYDVLKKSKLDFNDLLALCRGKDCFDINDIAFCIFETTGDLSVLLKSSALTVTCKDLEIENEPPKLSVEFVVDGKISKNALKLQNKSLDWLYQKLNINSSDEIKKIALAIYDSEIDDVIIHYKNDSEKTIN